ncbi:LysR family transcriptional regulator [Kitasatospora atroaurantiaca]|uniref:DNA-binding transcriptional LysR family regulator n=1 Tax=Kitasatospora atroaurantiaca TaxID=285545 RepID=A0A561ET32_9ACTN|nr:LysR family transcriptional regulator [Kitasatospora atroaurantiaca]TWE18782.1 DNA-binding transcriptional LysR family regulator [Kitasatospora atroaurantiaca]
MTDWDLRKLRVLQALDECGTVTAAAERLRMTPSAVSQQLATLARQLGAPMLEPYGRRVRLTAAARLVLGHAERVFGQLEQAEAELAGYLHGVAGEVRIGAFATAIGGLVVPAIGRLRESAPQLTVRVLEAEAADAYRLLAGGEVDLAVSLAVQLPSVRDPRFVQSALLSDPLDVALPAGHPLAEASGLRLADLAHEPWIYGSTGPWRDITLAACADAGFVPERAHTAADWAAILAMVAGGLGVALVPRLASADRRAGAVVRALPADLPTRQVVAAVRTGTEGAPPLQRVLAELKASVKAG